MHGPIGRLPRALAWFEDHYCRVDLRWLGAFRIVYGLLLCVDLLRSWANATDFYTNDGILPNHFSLFRPLGRGVFSLYHAFSTLPQVNVAFALTLLVFLTFALGYRTRLFHVLSLICITSLDSRNLLVENGGTVVVNLLCFWTLFLPLGRRLSLDALFASMRTLDQHTSADLNRRQHLPEAAQDHYSLAVLALLLQWSAIYFFNVVHKTGQGWHNGSALHWFLHQNRIVTWLGIVIREHAPFAVLRAFTYATLVVEGALAGLLLVPFGQLWVRRLALVLALGLHGSIAATARLGPFSYAMLVFFLIPLSAADWSWVRQRIGRPRKPLTLIFDADCGVCFSICRVLQRWDVFERLHFVGNDEHNQIPSDLSDELLDQTLVVLTPEGQTLTRERAVSATLSALPFAGVGMGLFLRLPGISWLARRGYDGFAKRRHIVSAWLGLGACGVARPEPALAPASPAPVLESPRLWPDVVTKPLVSLREAMVLMMVIAMFNQLGTDNDWARRRFKATQPAALLAIIDTFRLYQGWRMFAPEPPYEDGHMVVDGRTVDGRKIDPLTGLEPDFNPETHVGWGHNQFWCDYHLKMYFSNYAPYRQHLKEYLERWYLRTGHPEDRLLAFDVWWVSNKSPPPGSLQVEPLKPQKLVTFGDVKDSGAEPWLSAANSPH
ncbi:MAG TPA: DCC1-like thiol-disulfide oxidoreductase family protein [Polyangiaceae bacterium]|nr:DCC1-like thiol-disulfide oxidoreductase family protein [Polyangiaceae bacterium]